MNLVNSEKELERQLSVLEGEAPLTDYWYLRQLKGEYEDLFDELGLREILYKVGLKIIKQMEEDDTPYYPPGDYILSGYRVL